MEHLRNISGSIQASGDGFSSFAIISSSSESDIKILFQFYLDEHWCDLLKDKTTDIEKCLNEKYLLKNNNNENYFSIELTPEEYRKFSDSQDEEKQKEIIKTFFNYVLKVISEYL